MKNIIMTALAAVQILGSYASLSAEQIPPPIRPWTDPWGDARIWQDPWEDSLAWWWDNPEEEIYS